MLTRWLRVPVLCGSLLLSLSIWGVSQTPPQNSPRDVEVCELTKNPTAYDKQLVRVRGRLEFEFEGQTVDDRICGMPLWHTGIWWSYGDDILQTPSRETKRIQPIVSPTLRDHSFQTFEEYSRLRRAVLPDKSHCRSHRECAYYDVIATFTGKFFAREPRPHRGLTGFGHMGCCHLFVIEQVSDVSVQRTPVPPDDQAFSCTTTAWQSEYPVTAVSSINERVERNRQFLMDQARSHGDDSLADKMKSGSQWQFVGLTGSFIWSSPDLLTTYAAQFPKSVLTLRKKRDKQPEPTMAPLLMNVSREYCEPIVN